MIGKTNAYVLGSSAKVSVSINNTDGWYFFPVRTSENDTLMIWDATPSLSPSYETTNPLTSFYDATENVIKFGCGAWNVAGTVYLRSAKTYNLAGVTMAKLVASNEKNSNEQSTCSGFTFCIWEGKPTANGTQVSGTRVYEKTCYQADDNLINSFVFDLSGVIFNSSKQYTIGFSGSHKTTSGYGSGVSFFKIYSLEFC